MLAIQWYSFDSELKETQLITSSCFSSLIQQVATSTLMYISIIHIHWGKTFLAPSFLKTMGREIPKVRGWQLVSCWRGFGCWKSPSAAAGRSCICSTCAAMERRIGGGSRFLAPTCLTLNKSEPFWPKA